jgi:hypothetical protein
MGTTQTARPLLTAAGSAPAAVLSGRHNRQPIVETESEATNMTKRKILSTVGAMALVAGVFASRAHADTVPGLAGAAWQASEATCFNTSSFSTAVKNTCSGGRSWLVPLTISWSGTTFFRASSTFAGGQCGPNPCIPVLPQPTCRYVVRDAKDAELKLGSATTIGSPNTSLGSFSVPANSSGHIDCVLPQNGYGLSQIRWSTT